MTQVINCALAFPDPCPITWRRLCHDMIMGRDINEIIFTRRTNYSQSSVEVSSKICFCVNSRKKTSISVWKQNINLNCLLFPTGCKKEKIRMDQNEKEHLSICLDNVCFCWASIPLNIYTHFCDACPWKVVLGIPGVRNKLGNLNSNKVFLITPMQLVMRRTGGFCFNKTFRLEISSLVNNTSLQYHANTLLAPTGALLVMVCHHISKATF